MSRSFIDDQENRLPNFVHRRYGARLPSLHDYHEEKHHRVLIVGGDPVGLALAIALARRGIRSVVAEADETVCVGSRAICLSRRTLEILDRLGVAEPSLAKGLPWTGGRSFFRDVEVLHFAMAHDANQRLAPMTNIQQYYIEQFLADAAERQPDNIDLRWSTRVESVTPRQDGVDLVLNEVTTSLSLFPIQNRPIVFKDRLVHIWGMSHQTPLRLPRGRPRSFDVEAAVERAMGVFWSRGYHATALPDLLRATKLSRGSLYAAFGDKHSLFLRALDRYIADALTRMDIELDPRKEPVDGLRAHLSGYVDRTSGANGRRGCLLVATAMELAGQDAEVGRRVARFFEAMEAQVADALSRLKTAGKLADNVEPASAARILVCFVEGLRVVGKTTPTRIKSQAAVDALLDRFIR